MKGILFKHWQASLILLIIITFFSLIFQTLLPLAGMLLLIVVGLIIWQPLIGFCLMVFLIPLEDLTVIFPSMTLIKIIGLVTLWGWLLQLLSGKRVIKLSAFLGLIVVYVSWCAISAVWAINPEQSLQRVVTIGQLLFMLLLGYNLIDHKKEVHLVLGSYVLGAFLASCLGIYNGYIYEFTTRTVVCNLQNPNAYARLIGLGLIFGAYFMLVYKHTITRFLCGIACSTMFFAILLSGSRGAWMAILFVALAGLFFYRQQLWLYIKKPVFLIGLMVFLFASGIAGAVVFNKLPPVIVQRAESFGEIMDNRAAGRFDIWLVGLEISKNNLAKGVGLDNFPYAYTRYFPETEGVTRVIGLNKGPHNIFLSTLAELGVPGLLLLLALFASMWRLSNRTENKTDAVLCKLIVIFLFIGGITSVDQHRKFFWLGMLIPAVLAQFGVLGWRHSEGARKWFLFLAPVFPNLIQPNYGVFSLRLVQNLKSSFVPVIVMAPVPYVPVVLWYKKKWRDLARIPWQEEIEGVQVLHPRYLCLPGVRFSFWNGLFMYWSIYHDAGVLHQKLRFRLIHAYGVLPAGFAGLLIAQRFKLKSVCTAMGGDINVSAKQSAAMTDRAKYVLNNTGQVVAVGKDLVNTIEQLQPSGKPPVVIYNGVDGQMFDTTNISREHAKQRLGFQSVDRVILFAGRILRQKGVYELTEAFARLSPKFPEAVLAFVGSGEDKEKLASLLDHKGLRQKVYFAGQISHQEMVWWYAASEMVVLLSHHDGVPNVIKEAMSCARPVIATRTAGLPELVEDGKTGLLVKPGQVSEVVVAIEELLKNPETGYLMGLQAREMIAGGYLDWRLTAETYKKLYWQLISKPQ